MSFDEFRNEISHYPNDKIVFVGLGNELRGDDKAGLLFLERLQLTDFFGDSVFLRAGTNPENYLETILSSEPELVIFIDAVRCNECNDILFWISKDEINSIGISTHAFSIRMIEEYLKRSKNIEFKYFGIKCFDTGFGKPMSATVMDAINFFFSA